MLITLLIIYYAPSASLPLARGSSIRSNSRALPLAVASAAMAGLTLFLLSPTLCPSNLLTILQGTTIPVSLISKIPQILELNRNKEPGNLSAIVVFAQLLGTVARVFTTATETDDMLLLAGFAGATIFNGCVRLPNSMVGRMLSRANSTFIHLPRPRASYPQHHRCPVRHVLERRKGGKGRALGSFSQSQRRQEVRVRIQRVKAACTDKVGLGHYGERWCQMRSHVYTKSLCRGRLSKTLRPTAFGGVSCI